MRKRKIFNGTGGLLLLFLLLFVNFLGNALNLQFSGEPQPAKEVFVEAAGDVNNPAVYGFINVPHLAGLIDRAGGLTGSGSADIPLERVSLTSGSKMVITRALKEEVVIAQIKMSPFYRLTLGIPISINTDTLLGLTAVPGIGPKTAAAIISARERKGGFKQLKDLMTVRGISNAVYAKISPYLTL
ncbi:MAG: helix-hairpin-helix domain-containing protein [Deltaproteobacteria bacterium]|nr:helix-hairpin-helix domain-containing protein [Deltaproteobacteria bacterium]